MKLSKKALGLWISIIMLFSCMPMISAQEGAELHNVSLNKYVQVSSTYPEKLYSSLYVFDGNPETAWASAYYPGANFVMIDLLSSYPISEIRFLGRSGTADAERNNFKIEIATKSDFSDTQEVYTRGAEAYEGGVEQVVELSGQNARFVRVMKTNGNDTPLAFNEISVMSTEENLINVARGKTVEAPYTYPGIDAGVVVDGMPVGDWADGYVGPNNASYWQVDLGEDYQKYELEEIIYLPGTVGHVANPNSNFRIVMSSEPTFANPVEVYRNTAGTDAPVTSELRVDLSEVEALKGGAKTFRYVRVTSMDYDTQMTISEVSVLGRKIAGDGENVAKGKNVTASSINETYPPSGVVDGWYCPEGGDAARWLMDPYNKSKPWIMVDLGQEYRLNTLVFQMQGLDAVSYINFQIEVSMDESFENSRVVYKQGTDPINGRGVVSFAGDDGICRYIKIQSLTEIGGTDYQLFGVVEIAAYSTDLPYTPSEQVEFLTSAADATPVTAVPESETFAVRYKGANDGAAAKNVNLIQVGYTGDVISSVKFYPMSIPAGVSALPMVQTVSVADAAGGSFRFFVWEDGTLKPLVETNTLSRA